jgi:phenylacetate-CoA ligase
MPVTIWWNPGASMAAAAHMERQRKLVQRRIGRRSGYRQANLVPSQSSAAKLGASYFRTAITLPARFHVQHELIPFDAPVEEQIALLRASGAAVLGGYGSAVERLLLAGGSPDLEVVQFGADSFSEAARAAAEEQGVLVLGAYASVEAMRMGWECGHGPRLHLNEDVAPIRLVDADGATVPHGEPGRVVVSNLVNRATVLLNYVQGDVGVMEAERCPCGRNLSLMTLVRGRADEYLLLGGEEVHPHSMGGFATDGVRRFRLVQSEPDRLLVEVEPAPAAQADVVRAQVERWCSDRFAQGAWEVRLVDELRPGPNGKHRVVVGLGDAA